MSDHNTIVSSVVEMVNIAEVWENRRAILDSSFDQAEEEELAERHIRSTAGVLALKKAIRTLIHLKTGHYLHEKNLLISRLPTGGPILKSVANPPKLSSFEWRKLFLSISHSRQTAYGLAVYQGAADE